MPEHHQLKDHYAEARIFFSRLLLAAIIILLLVGLLTARFYELQVVNFQDYVTRSDKNRVQVLPIPPTRGLIYDRNGILLAENVPSYTLTIIKERAKNLDETLVFLRDLLGVTADEMEKFQARLKQRRRPYEAVPLRYRLNEDEIARLAVNEYRLPGIEVNAELVRYYPKSYLTAHNVGYVGRINDREVAGFNEDEYLRYSGTHTIGKLGLEKHYENQLLGEVGYQNVEINARGRILRVLERKDPTPGQNLTLYLDSELQQVAYDALDGRRGAVVAIEVATGGVLVMASGPSYDANQFVTGISYNDYQDLRTSLDLPLFNRTIQGQYPPGSTVKPMLGLAGLHYQTIDTQSRVRDPGYFQLEGEERLYRDWKRQGHGAWVDLHQAIVESCDTFFFDMAYRTGIDQMHEFGVQFGLGSRTGIDVPSERGGIWPSREWKRQARGLAWYPGDTLNVGIGQGDVLTTPMQLALMTSTLANKGHLITPLLVKAVGDEVSPTQPRSTVDVSPRHWQTIFTGMEDVIHSVHGTAQSIRKDLDYHMAGKTGTAQVVGIAQGEKYDSEALLERQRDHALFVAFAPVEDPKIAVAVIVENGEKSSSAAKIARKMLDAYMAKQQSMSLQEEDQEQ